MRLRSCIALAVFFLAGMVTFSGQKDGRTLSERLYLVDKVNIGDMGQSDEAARFRILLGTELSARRFTIVDKSEDADGILTGVLVVRVYPEGATARATVQLKDRESVVLWSGDFGPKFRMTRKEPVALRAVDVAEALSEDREMSRKIARERGAE